MFDYYLRSKDWVDRAIFYTKSYVDSAKMKLFLSFLSFLTYMQIKSN